METNTFKYINIQRIFNMSKSRTVTFNATLISRGRITIPEASRIVLDLVEGDIIEVQIKNVVKKQDAVACP